MEDEEKKLKALEIYQEMVDVLSGVDDIAGVVDIVNSLIKENGFSSAKDGNEMRLSKPETEETASDRPVCPICGSALVVKNGSSRGRKRYLCKHCGAYFGETTGKVSSHTKLGDKWRCFLKG